MSVQFGNDARHSRRSGNLLSFIKLYFLKISSSLLTSVVIEFFLSSLRVNQKRRVFYLIKYMILLKYMMVIKNRPSKMKCFCVKEFFFVNFDYKNGCKNEFEGKNEKSCSRFKNRVSVEIDFRAD